MTNVSNVHSSSLLATYLDSTSTKNLDTKTIFNKLSIDVGSDGKKITKDQLDAYVAKVKAAKSTKEDTSGVSDNELKALTKLQEKWNTIALGGDKITYANMTNNKDILTSMDTADKTKTIDVSAQAAASKKNINNYLIASALGTSTNGTSNATPSGAQSLLQTLLTGTTSTNDDSNADLIGALTNFIANSKANSTVETEA